MKFKELQKEKVKTTENKILDSWKKMDILDRTIHHRDGCQKFVFYDGPATANGMPGVHHMMAKFLKDAFCKYKTMKGYQVYRKVGWDTHGLPVELQVEKQLGFKNKKDIENYGMEAFNQKCKESVWINRDAFARLTEEMGQFIDLEHPYVTYEDDYIETEWWILKKFFEEGLFYEGHKVLPYCSRCGTGLASHEVAQGYKEDSCNTVIVAMKKKEEDVYFLAWTTTPWTLIANVALCVNPEEDYVLAESKGTKFILGKKLASKVLGEEYQVVKEYKGRDLEYMEYEQLMPFVTVNKKAFYVTCADYVTMEDGTGIVHMAPAFGQDDYNVGQKYQLPVVNPVGEDGAYTEGPWKGQKVFDVDLDVIKYLKETGKLFKKEKITHNYPHCWRCDTPLLYYAKPSYYLKVTELKDKIIANNNTVAWHPSYVGEKRFGNWLENMNDWALSRNRYWGTPLPLWRCECTHMEMIGSREELIEKAIEKIDETIELHRPYVDDIHIACPKCGKSMSRVPEVIDVWFDSGSMPFAQYHYPFENQELFESQFPADFICEGIDQTRGWFYTLLVISSFVKGVSPYKNVLVNDLLLDKNGKKMSKSKGNIVNPFELMEEYGADVTRFYLPYVSPVWTPIRFDVEGLKEVSSKFFGTLRNTYNFFAIYSNADGVDPREFSVPYSSLAEIDQWLLSKYHHLIDEVTKAMDNYDLTTTVHVLCNFVSEDLSNWYIRRNRRRFWSSELTEDKKAVYQTTYQVLLGLTKLIAPITPYIAEEIYRNLTEEESVHLADYPVADVSYFNEEIEKRMDLVRTLIRLGRNAREEAKVKVRQPISEAFIDGENEPLISDLISLIAEELNVKKVTFIQEKQQYMNFFVKPNFKVAGPIFGSHMKEFSEVLAHLSEEQMEFFNQGNNLNLEVGGQRYEVTPLMVDVRISAKDGFNVVMENKDFIILNTELTEKLLLEGVAREFVSKIQNMRKEKNLEVTDHIHITYDGDHFVKRAIETYQEFIQNETLAESVTFENSGEIVDLNGHETKITIAKV